MVQNSAYNSLKTEDPGLHVKLDSRSDNLLSSYGYIENIDNSSNYSFYKDLIEMVEFNQQFVTDGGDENDALAKMLERAEETTYDSISDIEDYTTDSYFRRIFYWHCFKPFKKQNIGERD
jgi:hypothetical protein